MTSVGFELLVRNRSEPANEATAGSRFPVNPGPADPPVAGSVAPRQNAAPAAPLEFEKLMELLEPVAKKPQAKAFAAAFVKEPELNATFEELKSPGPGANPPMTVEKFLGKLGEQASFRQLVARFAGEPGFRQMVAEVMSSPAARQSLKAEVARLSSALGAAAARSPARGRGGSSRATLAAAPGTSSQSAAVGATRLTGGEPGVSDRGAPQAPSVEPAAPSPAPLSEEELLAGEPPPEDDETPRNARESFETMCFRAGSIISRAECKEIEDHLGQHGIWQACVKADLFEKCKGLCAKEVNLQCGPVPDFYATCLSAGEPAAECAQRCAGIPGCTAPAAPAEAGLPGGPAGGGGAEGASRPGGGGGEPESSSGGMIWKKAEGNKKKCQDICWLHGQAYKYLAPRGVDLVECACSGKPASSAQDKHIARQIKRRKCLDADDFWIGEKCIAKEVKQNCDRKLGKLTEKGCVPDEQKKQKAVKQACKRYGGKLVELFGQQKCIPDEKKWADAARACVKGGNKWNGRTCVSGKTQRNSAKQAEKKKATGVTHGTLPR